MTLTEKDESGEWDIIPQESGVIVRLLTKPSQKYKDDNLASTAALQAKRSQA